MTDTMQSSVNMYDIRRDKSEASLLQMLKDGLASNPKTIPTLLLYDEKGLRIFEDITYLQEYYLTNAEIEALELHSDAICEHIPANSRLVELGSGNLRKVKILLEALERAQKPIDYFALDLSKNELQRTFSELDTSKFKYVKFNAFHGTYDDGLAWLGAPEHQHKVNVVMSLGSSVGNFDRDEAAQFLHGFSQSLKPCDIFLIGIDATCDASRIYHAYNDSQGVTEKFDRNGLDHANALLGYEAFEQEDWDVKGEYVAAENKHRASYVARKDVEIEGIKILAGEVLPFEQSVKFVEAACDKLWHDSGLLEKAVYGDSTGNHKLYVLKPSVIGFSSDPNIYAKSTTPAADDWHQLWAAWDTATRSMVPREQLLEKPIELRNNLIFYLGHIPTFADIHFSRATGRSATEPTGYSQIFERGIDPDVDDPTQCHAHSDIPDEWPELRSILDYQLRVRNRIMQSVESGEAFKNRKLARSLTLAYEHEAMHLETFLYMLLQSESILPPAGKTTPDFKAAAAEASRQRSDNAWHKIPATRIMLGADDPEDNEGPDRYHLWDNERPQRSREVHAFEAQSRPISVGEYARYLEKTHKDRLPASWTVDSSYTNGHVQNGSIGVNGITVNGGIQDAPVASDAFLRGKSIRTVYGPIPLKLALDWPVMASYDELLAYATWTGHRIPVLEELKSIYHYVESQAPLAEQTPSSLVPAVNGHLSNDGVEETPPSSALWQSAGSQARPNLSPGQYFADLAGCNVGFKNWSPTAVTADGHRLRGQSDVGGLWEWTSTVFAAHDGFSPMQLYPGYSADFFDNKHNICLGGSWATVPRIAGRKSFVNWYQRNYPFVWCTARLVRDAA